MVVYLREVSQLLNSYFLNGAKQKYNSVAGIDVRFASGMGGGGGDDGSRTVNFVVRGNKSHRELREIASNLVRELYATGFVQGIRSTANSDAEDFTVEILRDKASALNLEPLTIANTIDSLVLKF